MGHPTCLGKLPLRLGKMHHLSGKMPPPATETALATREITTQIALQH